MVNLQVALSLDRFWAVRFPISYFQSKVYGYKKWTILICVLLGFSIGSLHSFGLGDCIDEDDEVIDASKCGMDNIGANHQIIFGAWILTSTLTIIVLNGIILAALMQRVSHIELDV